MTETAILPATPTLADLAGSWVIDPTHSRIGFIARHAMVTKVRGSFSEYDATTTIDPDITKSAVTVSIKTASINTGNEQRDEHLRSNDFLDPEAHPEITFVSTNVTTLDDTTVAVTGDLTIKGVTRKVEIPFEFQGLALDPFGNTRAGFQGTVAINRSDYGVTWNAVLETGGVLVSDKIVLEFEVSAIRS